MILQNEIPISIIKRQNDLLLYFNLDEIFNVEEIEQSYLILGSIKYGFNNCIISCKANSVLTDEEFLVIKDNWRCQKSVLNQSSTFVDITEILFKMITKQIANNGILIKCDSYYIISCRMIVTYKREVIAPTPTCCCNYYDKEVYIYKKSNQAYSPWFTICNSSLITFFINNLSEEPLCAQIENSPNRIISVKDPKPIILEAKSTQILIPAFYSKFLRINFSSDNIINAKIWFQTQLVKVLKNSSFLTNIL